MSPEKSPLQFDQVVQCANKSEACHDTTLSQGQREKSEGLSPSTVIRECRVRYISLGNLSIRKVLHWLLIEDTAHQTIEVAGVSWLVDTFRGEEYIICRGKSQ